MTQRKTTRLVGPRGSAEPGPCRPGGARRAFVPPYAPSLGRSDDRRYRSAPRHPTGHRTSWRSSAFLGLVAAASPGEMRPHDARRSCTPNSLPFYGFWLIHYLNRRAADLPAGIPSGIHRERGRAPRDPLAVDHASRPGRRWLSRSWPCSWPSRPASAGAGLPRSQSPGVFSFYVHHASSPGCTSYHTIRQLRLVTALYAQQARASICTTSRRCIAFSTLSAQTAIGMLLILSGAVLITPDGLVGPLPGGEPSSSPCWP